MSRGSSGQSAAGAALGAVVKILVYGAILVLLAGGAKKGYEFGREIFCPAAVSGEPGVARQVTIGEGNTASQIAAALEDNGLIEDLLIFVIQAKLYEIEFQPGTYVLSTAMDSREILDVLSGAVNTEEGEE